MKCKIEHIRGGGGALHPPLQKYLTHIFPITINSLYFYFKYIAFKPTRFYFSVLTSGGSRISLRKGRQLCMKTKTFWPPGAPLRAPLDPPLVTHPSQLTYSEINTHPHLGFKLNSIVSLMHHLTFSSNLFRRNTNAAVWCIFQENYSQLRALTNYGVFK